MFMSVQQRDFDKIVIKCIVGFSALLIQTFIVTNKVTSPCATRSDFYRRAQMHLKFKTEQIERDNSITG